MRAAERPRAGGARGGPEALAEPERGGGRSGPCPEVGRGRGDGQSPRCPAPSGRGAALGPGGRARLGTARAAAARMQHPLELGAAHYFPAEAFPDHRSHRYRSFMIEEILTDPPDAKGTAPPGELLKFGVQALLSARPYHSHLGMSRRGWTGVGPRLPARVRPLLREKVSGTSLRRSGRGRGRICGSRAAVGPWGAVPCAERRGMESVSRAV